MPAPPPDKILSGFVLFEVFYYILYFYFKNISFRKTEYLMSRFHFFLSCSTGCREGKILGHLIWSHCRKYKKEEREMMWLPTGAFPYLGTHVVCSGREQPFTSPALWVTEASQKANTSLVGTRHEFCLVPQARLSLMLPCDILDVYHSFSFSQDGGAVAPLPLPWGCCNSWLPWIKCIAPLLGFLFIPVRTSIKKLAW